MISTKGDLKTPKRNDLQISKKNDLQTKKLSNSMRTSQNKTNEKKPQIAFDFTKKKISKSQNIKR